MRESLLDDMQFYKDLIALFSELSDKYGHRHDNNPYPDIIRQLRKKQMDSLTALKTSRRRA